MDGCVCTWWAGEGSRRRLGGWKGGQPLPGSGWVDPAPCAKASSSPSLLPGSLPTTPVPGVHVCVCGAWVQRSL